MAEIKYKKIENNGTTALYGMFDRNWMVGTCTEEEMRHTLALCEKDLAADSIFSDDYRRSITRLRASLLEALEVA